MGGMDFALMQRKRDRRTTEEGAPAARLVIEAAQRFRKRYYPRGFRRRAHIVAALRTSLKGSPVRDDRSPISRLPRRSS